MALALAVCAVTVFVEIVATGLVRCLAATATVTPTATMTAAATASVSLIAQVPHWATAVSTLLLMGVMPVMVSWGLVIAMGQLRVPLKSITAFSM